MEGMQLIQIGGIYEEILNCLRPWKILDQRTLFEISGIERNYRSFTRRVERLCKHKWLYKTVGPAKNQSLLFPSEKAIKEFYRDKSFQMDSGHAYHNFYTAKMVEFLMKYERFKNFDMTFDRQIANSRIEPDALIKGNFQGIDFLMSIEMELTQKEDKRIRKKFREYMEASSIHRVLYCFSNFGAFKKYHEVISTEDFPYPDRDNPKVVKQKRMTDKIILVYDENIEYGKVNPINSPCFYKGKNMTFKEALKL